MGAADDEADSLRKAQTISKSVMPARMIANVFSFCRAGCMASCINHTEAKY